MNKTKIVEVDYKLKDKCDCCDKKKVLIRCQPARHVGSPAKANFPPEIMEAYCSEECRKKQQKIIYNYYAELDRNASDSECFEHDHWEGKMRVGRCKITGDKVRVEPLCFGNNSGQPKECFDHFKLRK